MNCTCVAPASTFQPVDGGTIQTAPAAAPVPGPAPGNTSGGDHASHGAALVGSVPAGGGSGITRHGNNSLAWGGVPDQIADPGKSRGVYERLSALIARYPTEASLEAAGWQPTAPGGTHYTPPRSVMDQVLDDGVTHMQHLVVKDGKTVGAQLNSNRYDVPPAWGGLWHRHEDKAKESEKLWMAHLYVDRPFEHAFVE